MVSPKESPSGLKWANINVLACPPEVKNAKKKVSTCQESIPNQRKQYREAGIFEKQVHLSYLHITT
jgi:hypothetical protein